MTRVRLRTYRQIGGCATELGCCDCRRCRRDTYRRIPETVDGTIRRRFARTVSVSFDGAQKRGSCTGCDLLVDVADLEWLSGPPIVLVGEPLLRDLDPILI